MAERLRYAGEFVAVDSTVWRAEITVEAEEPFAEAGELTFEGEEAVLIDWPETPKEQPLCGSSATLRIESPGDRTYTSLYTVEPGAIRLRILRGGQLWWTGTLDPEFYEEPYERASLYAVSLTFSDFGILDRRKFTLSGMVSLSALLSHCLSAAGVEYTAIDTSMISSSLPSGAPLTLDSLKVRADNFYDEEGEAMTLREALEGAFQPLGLRMVQRAGKIYVYDLNGLYNAAQAVPAVWSGDSSTLGVDVVYNNAKITWSPYAKSGELSPGECWEGEPDTSLTNLLAVPKTDNGCDYLSYHLDTDLQDWPDTTDCGFTLWTSSAGKNAGINTAAFPEARFFKIVPQYDGEESEGVAIFWNGFRGYRSPVSGEGILLQKYAYGVPLYRIKGSLSAAGPVIFSSSKVWLPPVTEVASRSLRVRVGLDLLFDPRFNPFASASDLTKDEAEKDWQAKLKARYNFLYVPVTIKFRPDGSPKIWCWTNRMMVGLSPEHCLRHMGSTLGQWAEYNAADESNPPVWGYLSWYDPRDRKENSGIANGWSVNRPAINPHFERITTWLSECPDGQYLPWPPEDPTGCGNIRGGELWVEVRSGWILSDGGVDLPSGGKILDPHEVWTKGPKVNWILTRLPKIEIVRSDCFDDEIPDDDIEYSAELHPSAKDPLEIDTVCGTSADGVPTARGAYFLADSDRQLTSLTRAGRTATAEELLIGTLYSQYAERRTKLSGEIELPVCGLAPFTEGNQPGLRFILTAETQNLLAATSEAVMVELRPDEYDKDNGQEV